MTLDERFLEVKEFLGEGYQPCVDFGRWRVAVLRYIEELHPENIDALERHNETDEVFVLLAGKCVLLIGDGDTKDQAVHPVDMDPGKIYNIKKGVYHSHALSRDALVLIVENRDTGATNSDRLFLTEEHREEIRSLSGLFEEEK